MRAFALALLAAQVVVRVPAGKLLTATLQGTSAEARVGKAPQIVDYEFGKREQGQFRPYAKTEPVAYDKPFVVRVRFDAEPSFATTELSLGLGGGARHPVALFKIRSDPKVFESKEMVFESAAACGTGAVCEILRRAFAYDR